MLQDLIKKGFKTIDEINDIEIEDSYKHAFPYHMCVLAKTPEGLKNMFRLVSLRILSISINVIVFLEVN